MAEGLSDENTLKYRVPQGTLLGPSLFHIYINGLFSLKCNAEIFEFADGMAILFEQESWYKLKIKAEINFRLINKWLDFNLLTLNINKTF